MADKIKSTASLEVSIILKLTEIEARALRAITVYGAKAFTERFYESLGKVYLEDYEAGIDSLFETIGNELPPHLSKADDTRAVFQGLKKAVDK